MAQAEVDAPEGMQARGQLVESVGPETQGAKIHCYQVTMSRVLAATQEAAGYQDVNALSREAVGNARARD